MRKFLQLRRPITYRQAVFAFLSRAQRLERRFKWMIVLATLAAIAAMLGVSPWGRFGVASTAATGRQAVRIMLGLPQPREEVDSAWKRSRELGIEAGQLGLARAFAEADPAYQRLMRYAGLDPGHGVLRWGNFNLTLLLPSKVFEAADDGRSYKFLPRTRSIWLRSISLKSDVLMFFLVPDGPGLAEAMRGTTAIPVESSRQSTNSWGLRGPEPDLDAPVRGIVLGDSYMQGMFIGDDETPPECLSRFLEARWKKRVSILNTGVMGYSPEQYYASLVAFADRFKPQFVVVSLFTNDFGDLHEVPINGRGDWDEGKYWLDRIVEFCRARQWPHVIVPAPYEPGMFARRKSGNYPGMISNVLDVNGLSFLDPTDAFIDAHLEKVVELERLGKRQQGCLLFNDAIGDGHFSAAGSKVWASVVGKRLALLVERDQLVREHNQPAPSTPVGSAAR